MSRTARLGRSSHVLTLAVAAAVLWTAPGLRAAQPDHAQPVASRHGMVATSSPIASRVGVDILKKGGNAIDAAVAVGFAWPSPIRSPGTSAAAGSW